MIYLDNNATTPVDPLAISEVVRWMRRGVNPSTTTDDAKKAKDVLTKFQNLLRKQLHAPGYYVLFTSGATESNSTALQTVVRAYKELHKSKPHVIVSTIEHNSIISCALKLQRQGDASVDFVECNALGLVEPESVRRLIRKNTCIVCVMYANNETGAVNDVRAIGEICRRYGIMFHSDATQAIGKLDINMSDCNITSLSGSFHKIHGPVGVGLLMLSKDYAQTFNIRSLIDGTQQDHLRGGTLNIAGIAGSFVGFRRYKRPKSWHIINILRGLHSAGVSVLGYEEYKGIPRDSRLFTGPFAVVFGPPEIDRRLPNTLLVALVNPERLDICNAKLKSLLAKHGFVISVGSACNTASNKASHVLDALNVDKFLRRHVIRISTSGHTKLSHIRRLVKCIVKVLNVPTRNK